MRTISLFAGAGGLDLGFKAAGHELLWANDYDPDACATYRRNLGDHIVCGDVRAIASSEIPDAELVIGGFPCQGFSVANIKRTEGDPRNALYLEFLRVIRDKRPRFFVAENVKGLLTMGKGSVIARIASEMEAVGYRVRYQLHNAADYGVAQLRERVFIVGTRIDEPLEPRFPPPTHGDPTSLMGHGLLPWTTVGEAFRKIPDPDDSHGLENHTYSKYKLTFNGYLGHRWIDPDRPAPTVTARGDDRGGVVVLHHPGNTRRMSARELATVQSFPLDFVFCGNRSSVYRQIGNAVPPLLAQAMALQLATVEKGGIDEDALQAV